MSTEKIKLYSVSGNWYKWIMKIPYVRRILLLEGKERYIDNWYGNLDATVYIIRWMNGSDVGLFGMFRYVVFHLKYADDHGWIPLIDWKSFDNPYLSSDLLGKENAWEYYFENPAKYSIDDVAKFKHIVLSSSNSIENGAPYLSDINMQIVGKYIQFSPNIIMKIEEEEEKIKERYGSNCRLLGVKIRGTDYCTTHPSKHAIQPTVENAIELINEYNKKWGGYDGCLLVTEDQSIIDTMVNQYGEWIYTVSNINRLQPEEVWYKDKNLKENPRKSGEDYCMEIGLLSRCDALIASGSQGTSAAILINHGNYQHQYLIDLGTY